jgi:ribA/ribD-fused uncharacterized protein
VEHYYQSQKSNHPEYRAAIRAIKTPGAAKRLASLPTSNGRTSAKSWFIKNAQAPRPDWDDIKLDVMRRADLAKFAQHRNLAELLLSTGDAELVEASPSEPFWGIGPDGRGLNWAGRILMEVRQRLRAGDTSL